MHPSFAVCVFAVCLLRGLEAPRVGTGTLFSSPFCSQGWAPRRPPQSGRHSWIQSQAHRARPLPPAYRVSKTAPVQGFSSASQCHFVPALVLARSKGGPVYMHPVGKSSDPCPASGPVPGAFESWRLPLTCSCSCRFLFFLSLFTSDHIFW